MLNRAEVYPMAAKTVTLQCIQCDVIKTTRTTKKDPLKYCSNRCQMDYQGKLKVDQWLLTGSLSSTFASTLYIRKHILQEQKNQCAICGNDAYWMDKPITFVLDHIDGNSDNNHRTNLRLICPNCDSQTDTFKSRKRGKGRHYRRVRYANGQSY